MQPTWACRRTVPEFSRLENRTAEEQELVGRSALCSFAVGRAATGILAQYGTRAKKSHGKHTGDQGGIASHFLGSDRDHPHIVQGIS
jgi:hypothetical protein